MHKDRFHYLCREAEAGRDAFVIHPASLEEGLVRSCAVPAERLTVRTVDGNQRNWDFHECEELTRMDKEWPGR